MEYNYALYERLAAVGERFGAADVGTYAINALRIEKVLKKVVVDSVWILFRSRL